MAQNIDPTEIQQALSGIDYPASKEELIKHAQDNEADQEVMTFLERIDDGNYESPADVQAELGKMDQGLDQDTDQTA
jgi:hypothetical protein